MPANRGVSVIAPKLKVLPPDIAPGAVWPLPELSVILAPVRLAEGVANGMACEGPGPVPSLPTTDFCGRFWGNWGCWPRAVAVVSSKLPLLKLSASWRHRRTANFLN